ncbi:MAG: FtsX-like permease family protein [Demequina sp.]|uniref:FtsX-like permease family protein n=1 Tax=Demequina sp. TaxID=2050685 RepID=UPI003A861AD6
MRPFAPARRAATAARIAWRDLRKDPRQGALVALLVALPATVLMAVAVVTASQQPTDAQRITAQLGSTEAWVQVVGPSGSQVSQSSMDPSMMSIDDAGGAVATSRDVSTVLPAGTSTLSLAHGNVFVAFDAAAAVGTFNAVTGPAWDPAFAGKYEVVAGRAPADDEIMVSSGLADRWGLQVGDAVAVGRGGPERSVAGIIATPHAVDVGQVFGSREALAPALEDTGDDVGEVAYLPDTVLDWQAVEALNADGVAVYSRAVAENPPRAYLDADEGQWAQAEDVGALVIGSGLGLLEVVLLAGAAFTVSMRRRQERLALLAATGASRGTLVSVGVWNGTLLGLAGGVIGVSAGVGIGAAWMWFIENWGDPYSQSWGLHVPGPPIAAVLAFTALSGALAALVPSIIVSRRDVMAGLRGSRTPSQVRRWPSVVGTVLAVSAVAVLGVAVRLRLAAWDVPESESYATDARAAQVTLTGVVMLFVAFIALTPSALRLAARVLGRVSLGARLATRDAARHYGRTVPVVAAIAVTVLMAGNVALAEVRNVEVYEAEETDQAQLGDAFVPLQEARFGDPEWADSEALLGRAIAAFPDAQALIVDQAQDSYGETGARASIARLPDESLCPVYDSETEMYDMSGVSRRDLAQDARCANQSGAQVWGLAVGGIAQLEYLIGRAATDAEAAVLDSGGAVALDPLLVGPDATEGSEGTVRIESYDVGGGAAVETSEPVVATDIPAIVATPEFWVSTYSVVLSPEAAELADVNVVPGHLYLQRDAGFTELEEAQLGAAMMREGEHYAYVARPIDWNVALIAYGSLVATLLVAAAAAGLALGLARAEARRDDLTLASLGASPRLSRSVAAWQGGILVGFAVGIGMVCAAALDVIRALEWSPAGEFAWDVLAVGFVAPPLIVGVAAWLMTKPAKPVHYRLAA